MSDAQKAEAYFERALSPPVAADAPLASDNDNPAAAETGISVGAVHRAKRQLEKDAAQGQQKAIAIAQQLPTSYVVKQDIRGVPQDVRRLTVAVYERVVENAIGRGLLGRGDRAVPWTVVSALFAGMFDDHNIEWLNKRGYLRWDQRGQGETIIAAVNALIGRHR